MTALLAIVSPSARARLDEAARLLVERPPAAEALVVAPSREAADDFVREIAVRRGAIVGVQRASLAELLLKLSAPALAARGLVPATGLGLEALAARVVAEATDAGDLAYLERIADRPVFRRALLRTLGEVRLAGTSPEDLRRAPRVGDDLARLARRYDEALASANVADRAVRLALARDALLASPPPALVAGRLVLLLDVALASRLDTDVVRALVAAAARVVVTVADGDARTSARLDGLGAERQHVAVPATLPLALARAQRDVGAAPAAPADPAPDGRDPVELFSAPGEGREAVEIARRVLRETARGVPFDRMAVLVRAAGTYAALLESAFNRAGVPAWFARGTRRPHRSGRAFLALLSCALEGLTASRFAEYLSLATVPVAGAAGAAPPAWVAADDEVIMPSPRGPAEPGSSREGTEGEDEGEEPAPDVAAPSPAAPWRWERLLNDAAVIGGADRWRRRLDGLAREIAVGIEEADRDDPGGPRGRALRRRRDQLAQLQAFALPIVERLASWPREATWPEWIAALEPLAPMVLARPTPVLAVLASARAMGALGPVTLAEVRDVLRDRLSNLHVAPPPNRFGRVFVGTPEAARGRGFDVVFVPGLAERMFPRRVREDPLLLDAGRARVAGDDPDRRLDRTDDRLVEERLRLRLAVGAASARLYLSFPSLEAGTARPRLPSLYALDVERAVTGAVPDHEKLARTAAERSGARLAWPAPANPDDAIDAMEHDLASLRRWLQERDQAPRKGRARYLLELDATLARSLRSRWARGRPAWTGADGIVLDEAERALLAPARLGARPYSVSALHHFAACPYQFYLASILRLQPRTVAAPVHALDPLTRGRLVHEAIARATRALLAASAHPRSPADLPRAVAILDAALDGVAARYRDDLAPAVDRIWHEEIASVRADLRGWLARVAEAGEAWQPEWVEVGFGFAPAGGRDAQSRGEAVTLDGGWQLHGIVDLVERRAGTPGLRVTDYKTGRCSVPHGTVVGRGATLQPMLYALAVEKSRGEPVVSTRLWYCTAAGRYAVRDVALTPEARRTAREVLEIVDRAIAQGFLPPAPRQDACRHCDFRAACTPHEERRVRLKDRGPLADLEALRSMR